MVQQSVSGIGSDLDVAPPQLGAETPAGMISGSGFSRAPSQPSEPSSTGPQSVSRQAARRNAPPGAGATPANASASCRVPPAQQVHRQRRGLATSRSARSALLVEQPDHLGRDRRRRRGTTRRVQPARLPVGSGRPDADRRDHPPRKRRSGSRSFRRRQKRVARVDASPASSTGAAEAARPMWSCRSRPRAEIRASSWCGQQPFTVVRVLAASARR